MDRIAVFVDAGYLFAQSSVLLAGKKLTRSELILDHFAAVKALTDFATKVSGLPLLRIYWYDGTSTGPTAQHLTLAHLSGVKLRLGFINSVGEQKGVDSLIVTDMINLARNRAMSDAVLLSGDEDLRVGVQQAQEFGIRVHLVGIKPSRGSQSLFLLQEADTTHEWSEADVRGFLACRSEAAQDSTPASLRSAASTLPTIQQLAKVAAGVAQTVQPSELPALVEAIQKTKQVPIEYDRKLLSISRTDLGRELNPAEKKQVRNDFLVACAHRIASEPEKA